MHGEHARPALEQAVNVGVVAQVNVDPTAVRAKSRTIVTAATSTDVVYAACEAELSDELLRVHRQLVLTIRLAVLRSKQQAYLTMRINFRLGLVPFAHPIG